MKKIIAFILFFIFATLVPAQCVYDWGTHVYSRIERTMAKDHQDNMVTVSEGASGDAIIKRDSHGNVLFTKTFYANTGLITWDCYIDVNNNIYVTGAHQGTLHFGTTTLACTYDVCYQLFVLKLDSNGNLIWIKRSTGNYGSSSDGDDMGWEVSADSAGNCYLAGTYDANFIFGGIDLSGTGSNNFTAKLNGATGAVMWIQAYNDYSNVLYAPKTEACHDGRFYQVANYQYSAYADSATVIPASVSAGNNIYVAFYDTNGNLKWDLPSIGEGIIESATMDSHQNLVFVGNMRDSVGFGSQRIYSPGQKSAFYVKVDSSGNILSLKRLAYSAGTTSDISIAKYGVDVDNLDNVYISGTMNNEVDFNGLLTTDVITSGNRSFVAKYNNAFVPQWYNIYGKSGNLSDLNMGVVKLDHKNAFVTGYFYEELIIDFYSYNFSDFNFYEYFSEICDANGSFADPAGISEQMSSKVSVYPNPAVNFLNVEDSFAENDAAIEIYNSSGEQIFQRKGPISGIDLRWYANGLYFLKVYHHSDLYKVIKFSVVH